MKTINIAVFTLLVLFNTSTYAVDGNVEEVLLKEDWRTCPLRIKFVGNDNWYAVKKSNLLFKEYMSMAISAKISGQPLAMWIPVESGATTDTCSQAGEQVREATTMALK